MLAAKFGQQLIETNESMKERYQAKIEELGVELGQLNQENEALKRRVHHEGELKETIAEVESRNQELAMQVEAHQASESYGAKVAQRKVQELEEEVRGCSVDLQKATDAIATLQTTVDSLRTRNAALEKEEKTLLGELGRTQVVFDQKDRELMGLKRELEKRGAVDAQEDLDEALRRISAMEKEIEFYAEVSEEAATLRQQNEELTLHADDQNAALEESRQTITKLKASLEASGKFSSGDLEETYGKSLLSEVEDRRVEVESKHHSLKSKHQ